MNISNNNNWLLKNTLSKGKNQRYYYDFGTGNKIEREEVRQERDAFHEATNKTSAKPVQQNEDPFLEGFNDPYGEKKDALWAPYLGGDLKSIKDKELFLEGFVGESEQLQNKAQSKDAIEFGEDSETNKILQDLSSRWYATSDPAEKDRLHKVAEEVRRLARGNNRVKYGTDEIFDVMHKNAKTGQLVKGISLGTIPMQSVLTNPILAGVSGSLLEPGAFLTTMALDKNQWNYKYQDEWRVGGVDEKGNKLKYYDGKDLDADNNRNWLPWIYFDGYLIGADKFGNMNMAYVGKKMGLPEWVYKNFTTMDDPEDIFWIDKGTGYAESGR